MAKSCWVCLSTQKHLQHGVSGELSETHIQYLLLGKILISGARFLEEFKQNSLAFAK